MSKYPQPKMEPPFTKTLVVSAIIGAVETAAMAVAATWLFHAVKAEIKPKTIVDTRLAATAYTVIVAMHAALLHVNKRERIGPQ